MTELVVSMSVKKAQQLTEEIGQAAFSIAMVYDRLRDLVEQAKAGNAHLVLGYHSWTAYLVDALNKGLDGAPAGRLTTDERREVVAYLAGEGVSTRAIGSAVGVNHSTVVRDLKQVVHDAPPDPDGVVREVSEAGSVPPSRRVTGVDGKTYRVLPPKSAPVERPERQKPRRRPLNEAIRRDLYDLQKIVEKLDRDTRDDRFRRLDRRDLERANNEFARLHKQMFQLRQRFSGGTA